MYKNSKISNFVLLLASLFSTVVLAESAIVGVERVSVERAQAEADGSRVDSRIDRRSDRETTRIEIEGARIRGNQELPTVLYVVPWQAPKVYQLEVPKTTLATQRPIKALDRDSFKRLLSYHASFISSSTSTEQEPSKK